MELGARKLSTPSNIDLWAHWRWDNIMGFVIVDSASLTNGSLLVLHLRCGSSPGPGTFGPPVLHEESRCQDRVLALLGLG